MLDKLKKLFKRKTGKTKTAKPSKRHLYLAFFLYLFGAFVFYGSELLSPLHLPLALLLLYFGTQKARLLYKLYYKKYQPLAENGWHKANRHKKWIILPVVVLFFVYILISLVPTDQQVFSNLSHNEIESLVHEDQIKAAQSIDMISVTGEQLLNNVALYKKDVSVAEQESLQKDWNNFLGATIASEQLTDTHRYFAQIPVFTEKELHAESFTISYALYMKKFEYFHKVIDAVGTNNEVRTILNEYSSAFGGKNSYTDVTNRFFATNSFLRRNMGYLYHIAINPNPNKVTSPEQKILLQVADESYDYLFKNAFSHITHRGVAVTNTFNDSVDSSWLPIQKTVFVDTIGNIHVGNRKEKFITESNIATMKQSLNPGDIFVARKNWYASNAGIPGFWTHAGLYTGTLADMETYFADIFPYNRNGQTYTSLSELLEKEYNEAYQTYIKNDEHGHLPSVIESETKGTSIQSVEYSAAVDYFAVMRTNLPKKDILESLLRVFPHQHKPYDYEFSLTTKDEIFCSELVFDAYATLDNKQGVVFPTSVVAGKEIVSPNDIVKKFIEEDGSDNQDLSFVYFLDGNEEKGTVHVADKATFKESFARPKFSFLQE